MKPLRRQECEAYMARRRSQKIVYLRDRRKEYELDLSKYGDVRKPNPENTFLDHFLIWFIVIGGTIFFWTLLAIAAWKGLKW